MKTIKGPGIFLAQFLELGIETLVEGGIHSAPSGKWD